MQIGRHRRRRRHRVRQPEVERELRALRQHAAEDQEQRNRIPVMPANGIGGCEHGVEVVAPDDRSQHQHPEQEAEAARHRHDQRHPRAAARVLAVVPVGDQHERSQARQLPEHDELDQVAREYDAEHRAHEPQQEREEPRHRVRGGHVIACVQDDQRAHQGDEHREEPGKAVHPQAEVEAELREPGDREADDLARRHGREEARGEHDAGQGDEAREPGGCISGVRRQEGGAEASQEWKQDDQR